MKKKKSQGRENPTPNLNTDDKRLGVYKKKLVKLDDLCIAGAKSCSRGI